MGVASVVVVIKIKDNHQTYRAANCTKIPRNFIYAIFLCPGDPCQAILQNFLQNGLQVVLWCSNCSGCG